MSTVFFAGHSELELECASDAFVGNTVRSPAWTGYCVTESELATTEEKERSELKLLLVRTEKIRKECDNRIPAAYKHMHKKHSKWERWGLTAILCFVFCILFVVDFTAFIVDCGHVIVLVGTRDVSESRLGEDDGGTANKSQSHDASNENNEPLDEDDPTCYSDLRMASFVLSLIGAGLALFSFIASATYCYMSGNRKDEWEKIGCFYSGVTTAHQSAESLLRTCETVETPLPAPGWVRIVVIRDAKNKLITEIEKYWKYDHKEIKII